eukprot:m.710501 g.710501  ORF g.710501 m.710501 type:complete len:425 (+) comp22952_c0_seq8:1110-2384(+)
MFLRLSWTRVSTSQQQHVLRTLMTRATEPVVYLNGKVVPVEDAKVSVFDRGFLMADAVYEVTTVLGKKLVDFDGHVARLHRSMSELDMRSPFTHNTEILDIHRTLVERNNIIDGIVYTQVSRGADLKNYRSFLFPDDEEVTGSTVCMFGYNMPNIANFEANVRAMDVITVDDLRWGRRDIKTTQLLYPSLCKNAARAAGVDDAWMVDTDGFVTEGTSNNAYIVKDNEIITRHISSDILNGVTRNAVLRSQMSFPCLQFTTYLAMSLVMQCVPCSKINHARKNCLSQYRSVFVISTLSSSSCVKDIIVSKRLQLSIGFKNKRFKCINCIPLASPNITPFYSILCTGARGNLVCVSQNVHSPLQKHRTRMRRLSPRPQRLSRQWRRWMEFPLGRTMETRVGQQRRCSSNYTSKNASSLRFSTWRLP